MLNVLLDYTNLSQDKIKNIQTVYQSKIKEINDAVCKISNENGF